MAKTTRKQTVSSETKDEAMRIARATQRPGQTKEQTRLVAQGIQKGIDLYKKQQKAKARELDKKLKKVKRQVDIPETAVEQGIQEVVVYRQHWLPWALLAASWAGMVAYFFI